MYRIFSFVRILENGTTNSSFYLKSDLITIYYVILVFIYKNNFDLCPCFTNTLIIAL
jgi:hypothetical protein